MEAGPAETSEDGLYEDRHPKRFGGNQANSRFGKATSMKNGCFIDALCCPPAAVAAATGSFKPKAG